MTSEHSLKAPLFQLLLLAQRRFITPKSCWNRLFQCGTGHERTSQAAPHHSAGRRCCRTAAEMQLHNPLQKITQLMQAEEVRGKREIQKKQKEELLVKQGKLHHFVWGRLKQCHVKDERGVAGWGILQAGVGWQGSLLCAELCKPRDSTVWDRTQHLFDQSLLLLPPGWILFCICVWKKMRCALARIKGSVLPLPLCLCGSGKQRKKCNKKVWFHLGAVYVEGEELPAHTHSPQTAASY